MINFVTRVATEQHFTLKTVLFVPLSFKLKLEQLLQDKFSVFCADCYFRSKVRIRYEWVQSIKMKVRDGYSD